LKDEKKVKNNSIRRRKIEDGILKKEKKRKTNRMSQH
jgi:hypothetical protein